MLIESTMFGESAILGNKQLHLRSKREGSKLTKAHEMHIDPTSSLYISVEAVGPYSAGATSTLEASGAGLQCSKGRESKKSCIFLEVLGLGSPLCANFVRNISATKTG